MPCYHVKMPNGGYAIVKGNLGPRCGCGGVTSRLCDYPVGRGKTCDRRLCDWCGHRIGLDTDYCPDHFAAWKKFEESGGVREVLQGVLPFDTARR